MTKKTFVSGCFDLLHSGHVAFFQEAARYGELYVAIGSDRNIFELKQRPTINNEAERLYMIQALSCVKHAFVAKGSGILDFVEELKQIKPDHFVVNEDGSTPEKEKLCANLGIKYIVLRREPHSGLTARSTTALRSTSSLPEALHLAGGALDLPSVSQNARGAVLTISVCPALDSDSEMRASAIDLWGARLPTDQPEKLAKTLFGYCNLPGTRKIHGSAAAIGIVFAGLTRADYAGDYWPTQITNVKNEQILRFIESSLYLLPLDTLSTSLSLEHARITLEKSQALANAAEACWQALLIEDRAGFGNSMRQSFEAQTALFPDPLTRGTKELIDSIRDHALGWSLWNTGSRAGLLLVSDQPIENAKRINIRRESD